MCSLGQLLREKSIMFPRFITHDANGEPQVFDVTSSVTEEMALKSKFNLSPVKILLSHRHAVVDMMLYLEGNDGTSISGFPRNLARKETKAMRMLSTRGVSMERLKQLELIIMRLTSNEKTGVAQLNDSLLEDKILLGNQSGSGLGGAF